jgi:hypothetical protein
MDTINPSKIPPQYNCELCDYYTVSKKDYNKHLLTRKHIRVTNDAAQIQKNNKISVCICGKTYKYRQGLYKHKQTCVQTQPIEENIQTTIEPIEPNSAELLVLVKELMVQMAVKNKQQDELIAQMAAKDKHQEELMKQNQELQNTMREMIPHIGNNNNTTHVNGPTFNVQFFLENDCKNAKSIQEFLRSIEINHGHLVSMTKDGYVDTISNILIQALNKLEITERPLHCTDLKRETVYIKDKETWNKSTPDAPLMKRVISTIEHGCVIEVKNYVDNTPESTELDTPEYNFYHKAHWNTLGAGEEGSKLNKKIYKKVLPEVKLDKQPVS